MRILKLVSLMYLDVNYCNICMLFGISSEFKFCKKICMTLLSVIMVVITDKESTENYKTLMDLN